MHLQQHLILFSFFFFDRGYPNVFVNWYHIVSTPLIIVMMRIFFHLSAICRCWRDVFIQFLCPYFNWIILVVLLSCRYFYIFCLLDDWQIFSLFCMYFIDWFHCCAEVLEFDVLFVSYSCLSCFFGMTSKKPLPDAMS